MGSSGTRGAPGTRLIKCLTGRRASDPPLRQGAPRGSRDRRRRGPNCHTIRIESRFGRWLKDHATERQTEKEGLGGKCWGHTCPSLTHRHIGSMPNPLAEKQKHRVVRGWKATSPDPDFEFHVIIFVSVQAPSRQQDHVRRTAPKRMPQIGLRRRDLPRYVNIRPTIFNCFLFFRFATSDHTRAGISMCQPEAVCEPSPGKQQRLARERGSGHSNGMRDSRQPWHSRSASANRAPCSANSQIVGFAVGCSTAHLDMSVKRSWSPACHVWSLS